MICASITMNSGELDHTRVIPALEVLGEANRLRILHDLRQWLDTRQMPVSGQANSPNPPSKPRLVGAKTEKAS